MKPISLHKLNQRLRRTTWLPLGIMAAIFLVAMAMVLQREQQSQLRQTRYALDDVIRSQETQISQDIFLGRDEGINVRLDSILENWREKYPNTQACLEFLVVLPSGENKNIGACAAGGEPATILTAEVPVESLEIKLGNQLLARLNYAVVRPARISDIFPPLLIGILILGMGVAIFTHFALVKRVENQVLSPLLEKLSEDERNSAIAETTQMLAHDIRKPFQLLQIALVRLRQHKNPTIRHFGEEVDGEIRQGMRSVDAMIRDVLDVSREMRPNLAVVPVSSVMERLWDTVQKLYPESNVKLTLNFRRKHRVHADFEQLMRIIVNLTENAFQAVDRNGSVTVSAHEDTDSGLMKFSVQNDGPSIHTDDLCRIFTSHFTKRTNGTGLGLPIAKKLIEEHGGTIACSSSREGGTEFVFTIPLVESDQGCLTAKNNRKTPPQPEIEQLKERHILIFDDEKIVRDHWMTHAKQHAFQTIWNFDSWEDFIAQEGFKLADSNTIAFVDIHFKGSRHDGLEIARSLRRIGVAKVYAITGNPTEALNSGLFDDVFGKEIPDAFSVLVSKHEA